MTRDEALSILTPISTALAVLLGTPVADPKPDPQPDPKPQPDKEIWPLDIPSIQFEHVGLAWPTSGYTRAMSSQQITKEYGWVLSFTTPDKPGLNFSLRGGDTGAPMRWNWRLLERATGFTVAKGDSTNNFGPGNCILDAPGAPYVAHLNSRTAYTLVAWIAVGKGCGAFCDLIA